VHGVGGDAVGRPAAGRLDGEQDVGGLGLAVGEPRVVGAIAEVDVLEDDRRAEVTARAEGDDPGPAAVSRTASVTSAPAEASARAVSTPIPDEPPVTIARWPCRSIPATTSAAVASKPNGVVMRSRVVMTTTVV
jgi:hypothetical protein